MAVDTAVHRPSPRWTAGVALSAAAAAAALLVPGWTQTTDSGWLPCGSVVFKTGMGAGARAEYCELIGAYSDRLVATYVASAILVVLLVAGLRWITRPGPRVAAAAALVVACLFGAATGAAAWAGHDERLAPYPYAGIDVTIEPSEVDQPGQHLVTVTARNWTAPTPVVVTTCENYPDGCDLAGALEVDPVDGAFAVELTVDIPAEGIQVAAFDPGHRFYTFLGYRQCVAHHLDCAVPTDSA